jgi:hypothetical protein
MQAEEIKRCSKLSLLIYECIEKKASYKRIREYLELDGSSCFENHLEKGIYNDFTNIRQRAVVNLTAEDKNELILGYPVISEYSFGRKKK